MNKNDKDKQAPIFLEIDQQSALPKINIKTVLSAIVNEDITDLIPVYTAFLKRDLHLAAEMYKRRGQIVSIPYVIKSDDKKTKEILDGYLESIDFSALLMELSTAIPYGFSCVDMVYSANEGVFAPYEFHLVHQRYFEYERRTRVLSFRESSTTKTDPSMNSDKFILHYHKSDGGELVDYGVMGQIIFTALLKHATINANMQYFETLGVPPVIVKIDSSDDDELKSILNQVMSLRSNSIGLFPQNAVVDLLEGKASKTEFLDFIRYCDTVISHYIIGATLSGGKDQTGSFALGKVHDERRKDIMRLDARLLQNTITDLLKRILALNTPSPKPFTFTFDIGDETDEKLLSEVYKNLSDAGYDIPPEHIGKMFSIEGVTRKTDTTVLKAQNKKERNTKKTNSKVPAPFRIEDKAASVDTKLLERNIKTQMESVLESASDYEEAIALLIEAFPNMSFDDLSGVLEEMIAKGMIIGAAEVASGG